MKQTYLFTILVLVLFLVGCGGPKGMQQADTGDIPAWFTNVPSDPNYLFSAKTATSQDMQLAIDKSSTDCRADIATQLEVKVNNLTKKFAEETGSGNDANLLQYFSSTTKTVVSNTLTGTKIKEQKLVKDGTMWRAYVLIQYPLGAANEALVQQIKKNQDMYTKFQASKSFKELDDEVNKLDESKKPQ
ncbi:MAG: LPP20 family lipoprotein [Bacteroidota bacterium]